MPPASGENAAAEPPLSVLMAITGSASRAARACGSRGRVWDGGLYSRICKEDCTPRLTGARGGGYCLLEAGVYLMVTLQNTMAEEAECISNSMPQSLLHGDAGGPEPAPLAGATRQEELPPALCSPVLLRFSR